MPEKMKDFELWRFMFSSPVIFQEQTSLICLYPLKILRHSFGLNVQKWEVQKWKILEVIRDQCLRHFRHSSPRIFSQCLMIFVFDSPSVTKKKKNYNEQFDELTRKWNNGISICSKFTKNCDNLPRWFKLFNSDLSCNFRERLSEIQILAEWSVKITIGAPTRYALNLSNAKTTASNSFQWWCSSFVPH